MYKNVDNKSVLYYKLIFMTYLKTKDPGESDDSSGLQYGSSPRLYAISIPLRSACSLRGRRW